MLSILNNVFSSRKTNVVCAAVNSTFLAMNLLRMCTHFYTKCKIDNGINVINQKINIINSNRININVEKIINIIPTYNSKTNVISKNNKKFYCFMLFQALGCLGSAVGTLSYYFKVINNPNIKLAVTIANVVSTTCLTFAMIPTRTLLQNNFEVYSQDHGQMMLYSYDIPLPIRNSESVDQTTEIYYNDVTQQVIFKTESYFDNNVTHTPVNIYKDRNDSNRFCFVFNSNEYSLDKLCNITQNYRCNAGAVQSGRGQ